MTRASAAEFILSLVYPSARAQAATGDLLEQNHSRSAMRLWASVLGVAAEQTLGRFIRDPLHLSLRAFLLWIQFLIGMVVLGFAAYLCWALIYLADNHTGLELLTSFLGTRVPLLLPEWIAYGMLPLVAAWQAGSSERRDLADCIAVALVWTLLGFDCALPAAMLLAPVGFLGGMARGRTLL